MAIFEETVGVPDGMDLNATEDGQYLSPDTKSVFDIWNKAYIALSAKISPACAYVISVTMVRDSNPNGVISTKNKLYVFTPGEANSEDEARGIAIRLSSEEFPDFRFHTVCSVGFIPD